VYFFSLVEDIFNDILLVKPLKCLSVMNKNGFIIENKAIPFKFTWEEEHL
jgi:hypothetical protein